MGTVTVVASNDSGDLRRLLRIPCRGRFMWPFAVAGLGLRYFKMSFSLKFGHPLRNPFRTAFRSVEILGLQSDWWANLTPLARVLTEWVKVTRFTPGWISASVPCGERSINGADRCWAVCMAPGLIGTVHKSVALSFQLRKITLPSYDTSHLSTSNVTVHPALQSGLIRSKTQPRDQGRRARQKLWANQVW